jgi:subtilisin family serine protease
VSVDTVAVLCHPATFAGTEYQSRNGTSFATAYVSGTAALILAKDPTATVSEVRAAIVAGADTDAALQSSTVTGKRLNVSGALAQVP